MSRPAPREVGVRCASRGTWPRWGSSEASSIVRSPRTGESPDAAGDVPRTLAAKRAAQLGDLPRHVRRRRVLAYLARRGYSGREVTDMVGKLLA